MTNDPLIFSLLMFVILMIQPTGAVLIDKVSPNVILFGLTALLIPLGIQLEKHFNLLNILKYALISGLALSIKWRDHCVITVYRSIFAI